MSPKCVNPTCGADLVDGAKFCQHCGSPSERPCICLWCGATNAAVATYCVECGNQLNGLASGIPLPRAREWREFFTELNMMAPSQVSQDVGRVHEKIAVFGGRAERWKALGEAGFPIPDDNPNDPWILTWQKYEGCILRLQRIVVRESRSGEPIRSLPAQTMSSCVRICATRERIAALFGRGQKGQEIVWNNAYSDLQSVRVVGTRLTMIPKTGPTLEIHWKEKLVGLPILPQWIATLVVVSQKEPVNAKALAEMDSATRQGRESRKNSIAMVMPSFARDIEAVFTEQPHRQP